MTNMVTRIGTVMCVVMILLLPRAMAMETEHFTAKQWVEMGKSEAKDKTKYELGLYAFSQALAQDPNDAEAYMERGKLYVQNSQWVLAFADLQRAIQHDPNRPEAYLYRAIIYRQAASFDLALADLNTALAQKPRYTEALLLRATIYQYNKKEYGSAIADYSQALISKPQDDSIYSERGLAYYENHQYTQSLADFNRAIALNPEETEHYYGRSNAYAGLGRYKESIQDSERCLTKWQDNGSVLFNLAQAQELNGQRTEALKNYEAAIRHSLFLDDACMTKIIARLKGDWDSQPDWL